jgi:hypothetical protein
VFTAGQQDGVKTMHTVSSTVTPLPYRHRDGKSHRFYKALLVHASMSEEGDIKLAELVGYTQFSMTGRMPVIQRRIKFKPFPWQPVK